MCDFCAFIGENDIFKQHILEKHNDYLDHFYYWDGLYTI
jgi:hypothetical protein